MSRLVKDGKVYLDGTLPEYKKEKLAFEKLEEIEDVEDELGIDLITLFKALKNGVYYKHTFNDKHSGFITLIEFSDFTDICYDQDFKEWCIDIQGMSHFTTKDYGKTWALTREELDNAGI